MKSFKDFLVEESANFYDAGSSIALVEEAFKTEDTTKVIKNLASLFGKQFGGKFGASPLPRIIKTDKGVAEGWYFFPETLEYAFILTATPKARKASANADQSGSFVFSAFDMIQPKASKSDIHLEFDGINIVQIMHMIKHAVDNKKEWIGTTFPFIPAKNADKFDAVLNMPKSKKVVSIKENAPVEEAKVTAGGYVYKSAQEAIYGLMEEGHTPDSLSVFTDDFGDLAFNQKAINFHSKNYYKENGSVTGSAGKTMADAPNETAAKFLGVPKLPKKIPVDELFQYLADLTTMVVGKMPKDFSGNLKLPDLPLYQDAVKVFDSELESWEHLKKDNQAYIPGTLKVLLVAGMGGVGKTFDVEAAIKKAGLKMGESYGAVTGTASVVECYKEMYKLRNGAIMLFDDCDDFLADSAGQNIIKGALDSKDVRIVAYAKDNKDMFNIDDDMWIPAAEYKSKINKVRNNSGDGFLTSVAKTHQVSMVAAAGGENVINETHEKFLARRFGRMWWEQEYIETVEDDKGKNMYIHKDPHSELYPAFYSINKNESFNPKNEEHSNGRDPLTEKEYIGFLRRFDMLSPKPRTPKKFLYDGRMIFISNQDLAKSAKSPHFAAILSRGAAIAINLSADDLVARIEMITKVGGFNKVMQEKGVTNKVLDKVMTKFRAIRDEDPESMSGELNVRSFTNAIASHAATDMFGLSSDADEVNELFFSGGQYK
jgi:hypothetical protein